MSVDGLKAGLYEELDIETRDEPYGAISEDLSRHLENTTSEVEIKADMIQSTRDRNMFNYYLALFDEELKGLEYTVTDFRKDDDGLWNFNIEIYTVNEMGVAYTEYYTYVGQDGKLRKL